MISNKVLRFLLLPVPVFFLLMGPVLSCQRAASSAPSGMEYAKWFDLQQHRIIITSPYGAAPDTLDISSPLGNLVCMSSSYVGFLDALGCDSVITAVSGLPYIADPQVRERAVDVGYDAALDYETIVRLQPDLLLTYAVSSAEPPYFQKLRDIGIRILVLHEHLESHPLARAEYLKLFGLLTGRSEKADSLFQDIRDRYLALIRETDAPKKVLVNIPYADQWFIPGGDNYMTRLIQDAGGEVLGAVPGEYRSSVIDVEKAFQYAQEADFWLNPGWCTTKKELSSVHPLFKDFPVFGKQVWNNTKQATPGGGNAFWETGPVQPDRILQDLRGILDGTPDASPSYYLPVL